MFKNKSINDRIEEKRKQREELLILKKQKDELNKLNLEVYELKKEVSYFNIIINKIKELVKWVM